MFLCVDGGPATPADVAADAAVRALLAAAGAPPGAVVVWQGEAVGADELLSDVGIGAQAVVDIRTQNRWHWGLGIDMGQNKTLWLRDEEDNCKTIEKRDSDSHKGYIVTVGIKEPIPTNHGSVLLLRVDGWKPGGEVDVGIVRPSYSFLGRGWMRGMGGPSVQGYEAGTPPEEGGAAYFRLSTDVTPSGEEIVASVHRLDSPPGGGALSSGHGAPLGAAVHTAALPCAHRPGVQIPTDTYGDLGAPPTEDPWHYAVSARQPGITFTIMN